VCTIERANAFVNRLTEEGRLGALSVIVLDELHLISDDARGYLLELLLAKLKYNCAKSGVQVMRQCYLCILYKNSCFC
jgi:replicative superfamily II helicase